MKILSLKIEVYKKNMNDWLNLHELTRFGKTIQQLEDYRNHYIITTKDKDSVKLLCDYFSISIRIFFQKMTTIALDQKEKIISDFIDNSKYETVIFIDDSVKHLDSVNDKRVKLFFANWGYDVKKNKYKVYDYL